MNRRGDGVGIEVLPGELRGVRLEQAFPGRVVAVARVVCDSNDDAALLAGLVSLRAQLGAPEVPVRVCTWVSGGLVQSIDITGLSPVEINVHRSTLDGVTATLELAAGPRRLLMHLRFDLAWWLRVERAVLAAGLVGGALEPTPVALARLVAGPTMQLTARRLGAEPWAAVVHDRAMLAAAPSIEAPARRQAPVSELTACEWSGSLDELRERLLDTDELQRQVNATAGAVAPLGLQLVNDPYPDFAHDDAAWGPRLAGALGSAVAAAGIAGRIFPVEFTPTSRALFEDAGAWVVERVGDAEVEGAERPRRRLWR